jgi:hypothetical protein
MSGSERCELILAMIDEAIGCGAAARGETPGARADETPSLERRNALTRWGVLPRPLLPPAA